MEKGKIKEALNIWWSGGVAIVIAIINAVSYATTLFGVNAWQVISTSQFRDDLWVIFALFCFIQIASLRSELSKYTKSVPIIRVRDYGGEEKTMNFREKKHYGWAVSSSDNYESNEVVIKNLNPTTCYISTYITTLKKGQIFIPH